MVDEEIESEESVEDAPKGIPPAQVASANADKVGKVDDEEEIFEEDLSDDGVSDFSISDTILSVAPTIKTQHSSNLENLADEKDYEESRWNDSAEIDEEEIEAQDFYNGSKDVYIEGQDDGASQKISDLYNETGDSLYSGGNESAGLYDAGKKQTKSYGELADNRRSGRSMLEIAGFEDKEKQKNRDTHGLIKYEGKTN